VLGIGEDLLHLVTLLAVQGPQLAAQVRGFGLVLGVNRPELRPSDLIEA
jgi:hypothetical protein